MRVLAEGDTRRILERLFRGPATQKELADELKLNAGTVSKHMKELRNARLVARERSHGSYELLFRHNTWRLYQAAVNLALEVAQVELEAAAERAEELQRSALQPAQEKMTPKPTRATEAS